MHSTKILRAPRRLPLPHLRPATAPARALRLSALAASRHPLQHARPIPTFLSRFSTSSVRREDQAARSAGESASVTENPSPESTQWLYEGRAATCADESLEDAIFGPSPRPVQYYTAILRNIQMINAFLRSVDLEEFRTGEVDEDSPVASARAALMTYADVAHRWLSAALEADTELSEELRAELAQCLEYFGKNLDIITLFESENENDDELKKPRWADICDIIVYAFNIAYAPLDRAAGGIQPHLRIFEAQITGGDIPEGTSRKAILVDDEAPET